jgi:hypothetical protein
MRLRPFWKDVFLVWATPSLCVYSRRYSYFNATVGSTSDAFLAGK